MTAGRELAAAGGAALCLRLRLLVSGGMQLEVCVRVGNLWEYMAGMDSWMSICLVSDR
jgi:hypothetical protein